MESNTPPSGPGDPAAFPGYFWAKTTKNEILGISVRDHCLNVGCVAEALISAMPPLLHALLLPGAATIAALHDVGKLSAGFQQKCPAWINDNNFDSRWRKEDWNNSESHHGKLSATILRRWFLQRWPEANEEAVGKLAHVVGAHHGSLFGTKIFNKPLTDKAVELFDSAREALWKEMLEVFPDVPMSLPKISESQRWVLAGMISVADWIGSDERFFVTDRPKAGVPLRTKAQAHQDAVTALARIGWKSPTVIQHRELNEMFGFEEASALQRQAAGFAGSPEVILLEAAMGAGKTEAALALAHRLWAAGQASGLYFALPTQVTSNRIHGRLRQFLERVLQEPALLRLTHMNSWLYKKSCALIPPTGQRQKKEEDTAETARRWLSSAKRGLLAPFGVGTIDQALLGVVAAKHFFVRQFALAGKVVVLDEVHSYDLYTGTLVARLVQTLRSLGATVIILSATLTEKRKRELLGDMSERDEIQPLSDSIPLKRDYPLLTVLERGTGKLSQLASEPPKPTTVHVRCVTLDEAAATAECIRRAEAGECVLWIRNTVAEVQAAMKRLRSDRCGDMPEVAALHSRFPFFRRERLERIWLNRLGKNPRRRPRGCVLVATQVVEQSVDIDADFMLTDLAPTDMLLQRIGRLWRHQERPDAAARRPAWARREVWVNHPDLAKGADAKALKSALGRSAWVYAPYVLLRSLEEWKRIAAHGTLSLPGDIRPILEATYSDRTEKFARLELWNEMESRADRLRSEAIAATRVWTLADLPDEEGVQTRWSELETGSLLLVRKARRLDGKDGLELEPLHGRPFSITPHDWKSDPKKAFAAAKTIHRNVVRVDKWLVREGIQALGDLGSAGTALKRYVDGRVALGIVGGAVNGPIRWPGSDTETRLYYDEQLGVERQKKQTVHRPEAPTNYLEEDDESRD